MPKLNFSVFTDKVESGQKTQTIRVWDQPSIKKMKAGDSVRLWWTKRGLKKGEYCRLCLEELDAYITVPCTEHDGQPEYARTRKDTVGLPRLLGTGTITEKFKLTMSIPNSLLNVWDSSGNFLRAEDVYQIAKKDGFKGEGEFQKFFERYGINKKPVEFAVIRWKLEGKK